MLPVLVPVPVAVKPKAKVAAAVNPVAKVTPPAPQVKAVVKPPAAKRDNFSYLLLRKT